jgi:KUP system potassium uptake protein
VVVAALLAVFMVVLLLATLPKVLTGGWLPLALGGVLLLVMTTWWSGRRRLHAARDREELDVEDVLQALAGSDVVRRVPGCAVFLTHDAGSPPIALRTMLEQTHVLHERVVLLSWTIEDKPAAPPEQTRVRVDDLGHRCDGVVGVHATFGYREHPNVEGALDEAGRESELAGIDGDGAVYFVSVPIPQLSDGGGMARWRQRCFLLLDRLASDPVALLDLPRERTVVIGRDVGL